MDGDDFDEEAFDVIVRDILMNITKDPFTKEDFNNTKKRLIANINKKPYTIKELNTTINMLLKKINKKSMRKKDVNKASNEIKQEEMSSNPFLKMDGLSFLSQVESMIKVVLSSLLSIMNKTVTLFVTICIVLNLYFRGNVDSGFLYPSDPHAFPYVYFNPKNTSKQNFLLSSKAVNLQDKEDDVFLDVPAFFTSNGKYSERQNICKINDPYGAISDCTTKKFSENAQYFNQDHSYENMNFFSKKFMENNGSKTSDELTLYGLITYIMLYVNIHTNGSLRAVDDFFKPFFQKDNNKMSLMQLVMFPLIVYVFYVVFDASKSNFSNIFKNLLFKNVDDKKLKAFDIFDFVMNVVSAFVSPFMFFSKLFFFIIFPMVLFHMFLGYMNYSQYASSFVVKAFCYLGISSVFLMFLTFVGLALTAITTSNKSIDDFFATFLDSIKTLILKSTERMLSIQNMNTKEEEDDDDDTQTEGFKPTKAFKKKKKKKKKGGGGGDEGAGGEDDGPQPCSNFGENKCKKTTRCNWDGSTCSEVDGYAEAKANQDSCTKFNSKRTACKSTSRCMWHEKGNICTEKETEVYGGGKKKKKKTKNPCGPFSSILGGFSFLSSFFKYGAICILTPIMLILAAIPSFITMYMTFSSSKSIAIDFIQYIGKLVCMMTTYKFYIRAFFFILVTLEMIKYMQKKYKFITCCLLFLFIIYDLRYDIIQTAFESNGCVVKNNTNIGENISNIILSER